MISKSQLFQVSRYNDWWGCKMSPLLAIGYGTALLSGADMNQAVPGLLLLLAALVIGGVYASTINDISDIREDAASGKQNRMGVIPVRSRWLFPLGALLSGGIIFFYLFFLDPLSGILYLMPCVSFSLYSLEPFRLKRRGAWGVLADASGAHLFPGLLMVAGTSAFCGTPVNWTWFIMVGIWSACFGLRGILWHQFQDRASDLRVGLNTFATRRDPNQFATPSLVITIIELSAFLFMVVLLQVYVALPFLVIYLVIVIFRDSHLGVKTGMIVTSGNKASQIFLLDYYTFFFPVSLLLSVLYQPYIPLILLAHLLLFPITPLQVFRNVFFLVRT